jgi:hypothetical protein
MHEGHYALRYKLCNWNQPNFSPITIAVETIDGQEVASQVYTPTVNIGGDVSKKFGGVNQQTLEFDINETGEYMIVLYADAAKNADFVLGQLNLVALKFGPTGVKEVSNESQNAGQKGCFDLSGRKVSNNKKPDQLKPGLYIIDGRKVVVK